MGGIRGCTVGRISEEIVEAALKRAVDSGKITGYMKVDGQGYDFSIGLPGQIVNALIEVKSSDEGRRVHRIKYGGDTPVIIVRHRRTTMLPQERASYISTAYSQIMIAVNNEMQKRRPTQDAPAAITA